MRLALRVGRRAWDWQTAAAQPAQGAARRPCAPRPSCACPKRWAISCTLHCASTRATIISRSRALELDQRVAIALVGLGLDGVLERRGRGPTPVRRTAPPAAAGGVTRRTSSRIRLITDCRRYACIAPTCRGSKWSRRRRTCSTVSWTRSPVSSAPRGGHRQPAVRPALQRRQAAFEQRLDGQTVPCPGPDDELDGRLVADQGVLARAARIGGGRRGAAGSRSHRGERAGRHHSESPVVCVNAGRVPTEHGCDILRKSCSVANIRHYRVTGKLGVGGMGIVYEAEDTRLSRPVAAQIPPRGAGGRPRRRAAVPARGRRPSPC